MKLPVRYLIPGIAALAALLLYTRTNQVEIAEHERFDHELDQLTKLDAELGHDVLRARFRLLTDYDGFAGVLDALRQTESALATLSASLPEAPRQNFRDKLEEFSQVVAQKEQLIEQFKSENAVLGNSLRYLPVASTDLLAHLHADPEAEALVAPLNRLLQQIFVHNLSPGNDEEPAIRRSLAELGSWRAQHPDHPQARAVAAVAAHATSIIGRKPKVEELTRAILALPSEACSDQLQRIEGIQLAKTMRQSNLLQRALEGIVALLLLAVGYSLYALQIANRHLERRVEERTRDLQNEALEHRRTADERDRFFAASLDLLAISAPDGTCRRVNPAVEKLLGWSVEESLSRPFFEFIHPDDRSMAIERLQRVAVGESAMDVEVRCLCKNGAHRWIAWTTTQIDATGLLFSSGRDVSERKRAAAELERLHKQLVETSRHAGMAEVATGVLHNVGNVLNSVNVSATLVADNIRRSKIASLGRAVALLDEHAADLGAFVTSHTQGKKLPDFLRQLHGRMTVERQSILDEVESLCRNVDHIKDIVAMQQQYAQVSGVTEVVNVTDLVEDSLRMNAAALVRHGVKVERDFQELPPIAIEKHKVLQILVNLIRNAKYACDEGGRAEKKLTLRVGSAPGWVKISVIDNGVGIPPENLTRIFNHGFTTRKDGHGFGLHSGALAAAEMRGSLRAYSDGPGLGATFTLELPKPEPGGGQ